MLPAAHDWRAGPILAPSSTPAADQPTANAAAEPDLLRRRTFLIVVGAILLVAGVWRLVLAAAMPCISRDGAQFCWQARDLGRNGIALLATDSYQQHPLFPATILGVQRVLVLLGAPPTPETWQRSGQIVAWFSGMAVVCLAGVLTNQLVRRLKLPVATRRSTLYALALAAVLPLNTWLSADVMSDQLHLALYLGGVTLVVALQRWKTAFACGLVGGLAFLTRPEGAVVCLAAVAALIARRRFWPARVWVTNGVAVAVGFLLCAGPFIAATGRLSPKTDKEPVESFRAGAAVAPIEARESLNQPRHAALLRREVSWIASLPQALKEVFRAGRVVIPLLALAPLIHLRRRLTRPPLVGLVVCMTVHFALTAYVLARHGYLHPRHTLVMVMLLVPLAAILLDHLCRTLTSRGARGAAIVVLAACFGPMALRSFFIPNGADAFIADAARWLREHDPEVSTKLLLGGSSQRRLAFYADLRLQPWPENEPTIERRFEALRDHLLGSRPDYFAIDTGPGQERAGNDELLELLRADETVSQHVRERHARPNRSSDAKVHIWSLDW